jgi:hypothetical protein
MKKEELIKGKWYLTHSGALIKFVYLKNGSEVWASEYITDNGNHYVESGYTSSNIKREANAEDYQKYPIMGVFTSEISNYPIF